MSLGSAVNGDGTDPISLATDMATDAGLVVALSAGNAGPGMFTVGQPAGARKPITVGASDDFDQIAGFSSRGPTSDLRLKPDVVAPGVGIMAPQAGTSGYVAFDGTSMAAPHVAGAAALVLQAHPDWTPLLVKAALMNSALPLAGPRLWEQGAGRIQVPNAVTAAVLVVEPSLSLGELVASEDATATLTLINVNSSPVVIDLSATTAIDGVGSSLVSVQPLSLTIPGNASSTATLTVSATLTDLEGSYEGRVTATYNQGTSTVPYLFRLKQPSDIAVAPSSFQETATELQLLTRTLTIANVGSGDLTFSLDATILPPPTSAAADQPAGVASLTNGPLAHQPLRTVVVDPDGDAGGDPVVDVNRIDAVSDEDTVTIRLFFSEDTFVPEVVGYIHLDVDQDPSTGSSPEARAGRSGQDIGFDFFLSLFSLPTTGLVQVRAANGNLITEVGARYIGQSVEVVVPLSALGNDDGDMDVSMALGNLSGPTDWAPDVGHGTLGALVPWVCFDRTAGIVAPGASQDVTIELNCLRDLGPETHTAEVVISSNDPDENPVIVPVTLQVVDAGPPDIQVTPTSFDEVLGINQIFTTSMDIGNVLSANSGGVLEFEITDVVDLATGLKPEWPFAGPLAGPSDPSQLGFVNPGSSQQVAVVFDTIGLAVGRYEAEFLIANNDPDENPVTVRLAMNVSLPDIEITPQSFAVTLDRNASTTGAFTITNNATGTLAFEISLVETTPTSIVAAVAESSVAPLTASASVSPRAKYQLTKEALFGGLNTLSGSTSQPAQTPSNDLFPGPVIETLPFDASSNTVEATLEPEEQQPCADMGRTVWYQFTPPADMLLKADTFGSGYDTALAVYVGEGLSSLQVVACNDDARGTFQSEVLAVGVSGQTYYFQVGGYSGEGGPLAFHLEETIVGGVNLLGEDLFAVVGPRSILRVDSVTGDVTEVPTPELASLGPDGLAASQDFLYYINAFGSNAIYKMTHEGVVVDVFATPAGAFFDGLAYNDGVLYGGDYAGERICALDPETGEVLGVVQAPVGIVGGMAPGPNGTLYVTLGFVDVVQIDPTTGAVLAQVFSAGGDFIFGLAFDGELLVLGSAGGNHLLVDAESGGVVGEITGLSGVSALAIPPGVPWLSVEPRSGTVAPGASVDLSVTFDATKLPPGTYAAKIVIGSNDVDEPTLVVPVTQASVAEVPPPIPTPIPSLTGWTLMAMAVLLSAVLFLRTRRLRRL